MSEVELKQSETFLNKLILEQGKSEGALTFALGVSAGSKAFLEGALFAIKKLNESKNFEELVEKSEKFRTTYQKLLENKKEGSQNESPKQN